MKKYFLILLLAPVFLLLNTFTGCTYNDGVVDPVIPIDTSMVVSFSQDILPGFEEKCSASVCHATGAVAPDLTPANAYNELWSGSYIDTLMPEESELYQWMAGNRGLDMPLSGPDSELNAKVLTWIIQGAKNN